MTTLDLDALERAARAKAELGFNSWAFNPNAILSLISDYRALQERVEGAEKALRPFAEASRIFDEAALHFGAAPPDDAHRPKTEFTHGQLRAARTWIAARTKAGDPHEQE